MSNLLGLADQIYFVGERATGAAAVMQAVWVYNHAIDIDGLRRFHRHLHGGRLSRRVERSPLPFGRHRWVTPQHPPVLEVGATPRPREEFDAWLDAQAAVTVDLEHGPEWHLAVLPFTDGGAGISLVVSHGLTDGVGLCRAFADAACGREHPAHWPAAGARPRWRAVREDARQTARDIPAIGRAAVAAARFARRSRKASPAPRPAKPHAKSAAADVPFTLPTTTAFVDAESWEARAVELGGTGNGLLAGLTARLAEKMGRLTSDGSVTLTMPVSERTAGDSRANAVVNVSLTIDPAAVTTDLAVVRAATKEALTHRRDVPDREATMLPLVPLVPQWLVRRMVSLARGSNTRVDSSNLGVIDPAAYRPDGSEADHFAIRTIARGMTETIMRRAGGMLTLFSGRVDRQVFVSVVAYQPGRINSNAQLRQDLSSALSDFALSATTGWGCHEPAGGAQ